jgi:AcrR family transcriptional regulator
MAPRARAPRLAAEPTPTPRRRGRPPNTPSDQTAAAIVTAARREFAAHGYAGTSNRSIAEAAGLTHTAIYNHFSSKAGLFTAVFAEAQDLLVAELERTEDAARTGPLLPGALLEAVQVLRAADPSYVDFLASMYIEVRRHPELQVVFTQGPRFAVFDVIRRLAGQGADETDDAATWFWIIFAIGLAQFSTLTDEDTFATTVAAFADRFPTLATGRR